MKNTASRFLWVIGLTVAVSLTAIAATSAAQSSAAGRSLLSIGTVGPDAIGFKVWTDPGSGAPLKTGDRVAIHFIADRDCYVLAANVSPKGDVAIIFPNREQPDNSVRANKEYTLFGTDSQFKLVFGEGISKAQLVFYVSPKPIELKPLETSKAQDLVVIPAQEKEKLDIFRSKIEELSKLSGFNRKTVSLTGGKKGKMGLRLMGAPGKPMSEGPGSVTGTRGRSQDIRELAK